MKKIGVGLDHAQLDAAHIIEDSECCLVVPAVIAREGVFPYPEGKAYKSAGELRKAAWTADNAWIVADNHPDTLILMDPQQISGRVEKSRFADNAIKANLRFLKSKNRPQFLADIKSGKLKEVSIGFFYEYDAVPGQFNGKPYDFVQRNILIDHVAAGVQMARCAPPACGIAIDSVIRAAADPFAEYKNFEDCVAKNQDKEDPEAYCAEIKRKVEGSQATDQEGGVPKTDKERLIAHFGEEVATKLLELIGEEAYKLLPPRGTKVQQDQELSIEEIKQKIADLGKRRQQIYDVLYPREELPEATKQELQSELTIIEAELAALQEVLAAKMKGDQDEEGELEKKREAARERCGKYPVSLKEDGHLTKPSEYENIPEDSFADPCNFRYPIDEEHLMAAWAYISKDENRAKGGYSEEEWTWMKNRVKKRMEAKGHEVEADALHEIERAKRLL